MPDPSAAAGIERVALVRGSHIHDSVDDDRRALQAPRIGNGEHPPRRQLRDVVLVDLGQRRVAIAAGLPVVGRPPRLGRDDAESIARAPQQVHALVVGPQLEVVEAFADYLSFERASVRRLNLQPHDGGGIGAPLNRAQEPHEHGHLGVVDDAGRHALGGNTVADCLGELLVVERRDAHGDRRTHLATVTIGTVAPGAPALERRPSGIDVLGVEIRRYRNEREHAEQAESNAHEN